MEFMLDTYTCIYIIKRKPSKVIERFKRTEISQIGISSITLSELLYGVSKSTKPEQNHVALAQFVAPLEILPYGDEAAQHYGAIRAQLEKKGTPIGSLDMLIAAPRAFNCLHPGHQQQERIYSNTKLEDRKLGKIEFG